MFSIFSEMILSAFSIIVFTKYVLPLFEGPDTTILNGCCSRVSKSKETGVVSGLVAIRECGVVLKDEAFVVNDLQPLQHCSVFQMQFLFITQDSVGLCCDIFRH